MAIFRGVNTSVAGMSLHSPYKRSTVLISQLPANAQIALNQTISSKGLTDAQAMVGTVETVVGACRKQWQQLEAWKTVNDDYQARLAAYHVTLAHLRPKQKAPAPPAPPPAEPPVPQAASCGPASAFGIASSALPPGISGAGTVAPGASSSTLPTATPTTPASTASTSATVTGKATPPGGATHPANVPTTVHPAA
jgi:hypothetical protein